MFKKFFVSLVCLLSFACCAVSFNVPVQNQGQSKWDVNTSYSSVIKILAKNKKGEEVLSGSGFAINENDIITAGHVCKAIQETTKIKLTTNVIYYNFYGPDGQTILEGSGLAIMRIDRDNDICLMQKANHGLTPVKFIKDYSTLRVHATIYVVGSPLGAFETYFEGHVILKDASKDSHFLVIDAPAAHGNSGGPVFNDQGEVVGMLVSGPDSFDHLRACVPSWQIVNFINGK